MPDRRIRSFVAFEIGEAGVLKRIADAQRALVDTGADLRLVKPENIHVTVRFLGDISPIMADMVRSEMNGILFRPFEIELRGLGAFPDLRHARVIWIGIKRGRETLMKIFDQLEGRLRKLGFTPDRRGFSPHVTIARVKSRENRDLLIRQIVSRCDYDFGTVKANSLKLMESVLTPKGPVYSTLHEVRAT